MISTNMFSWVTTGSEIHRKSRQRFELTRVDWAY